MPDFAVHLLGDLLHAAEALGCRSLQVCPSLSVTLCAPPSVSRRLLPEHLQHHVTSLASTQALAAVLLVLLSA